MLVRVPRRIASGIVFFSFSFFSDDRPVFILSYIVYCTYPSYFLFPPLPLFTQIIILLNLSLTLNNMCVVNVYFIVIRLLLLSPYLTHKTDFWGVCFVIGCLFVCLLVCFVVGDQFMASHFKEHFCSRLHAFSTFLLSVESTDEVLPLNQ